MFRVLFLAKIIVVCIPADLPIILCFHFPDFFIQFSRYTAVSSLSLGTCLQFVAFAPNLPFVPYDRKNSFSLCFQLSRDTAFGSPTRLFANRLQRSWWWAAVSSLRSEPACNSSLSLRICLSFLTIEKTLSAFAFSCPATPLSVPRRAYSRTASSAAGGGLKWTRTTDLTLIRRAL